MRRVRAHGLGWILACAALAGATGAAPAPALEPAPEGLDAGELARRAEASLRGERTTLQATLSVSAKRSAAPRQSHFRAFHDGSTRRSLVRFSAPKAEAGRTFLSLPPNLWTYEPDEERPRRVLRAELREPFLKGDFTIDDLVWSSSLVDDYDHELLGVDPKPDGLVGRRAYVVRCSRRTPSPTLWSRIHLWIDSEWGTPLRREDYDESGRLVRIVRFGGIRPVQGRYYPYVWTAESPAARGRESRIDVESVDFEADIAESVFTPTNLTPTR